MEEKRMAGDVAMKTYAKNVPRGGKTIKFVIHEKWSFISRTFESFVRMRNSKNDYVPANGMLFAPLFFLLLFRTRLAETSIAFVFEPSTRENDTCTFRFSNVVNRMFASVPVATASACCDTNTWPTLRFRATVAFGFMYVYPPSCSRATCHVTFNNARFPKIVKRFRFVIQFDPKKTRAPPFRVTGERRRRDSLSRPTVRYSTE